jgi:ribonuclease HII
MLIAGVDEAGRGCIIGPLVVAGFSIRGDKLSTLTKLGIKDSKLLSPKKREVLYMELRKVAESYHIIKLTPQEIDQVVRSKRKLHKLNRLEAETMADIINILKPDYVYVDAADVLEDRFKHHIQERLVVETKITARHKADKLFPVVSAASIIAKVERDKEISELKVVYGDFGSGYLADPKTLGFLKTWIQKNSDYPECVRRSWKTAKQVKDLRGTLQKKLF